MGLENMYRIYAMKNYRQRQNGRHFSAISVRRSICRYMSSSYESLSYLPIADYPSSSYFIMSFFF